MKGGDRYYVIENKTTGEHLIDSDPITGYEETLKFKTEREATEYLEDNIEDPKNYEVISLRW